MIKGDRHRCPPGDRARARRPGAPRAVGAGPPTLARRRASARPPGHRVTVRAEPARRIRHAVDDSQIAFDERGLVPCIVQDWRTGEVLTLAYMNAESLRLTRETGETHFFSRSRQELWHKGATSGNTQQVRAIRYDCDGDALLALVEPTGPACHTGERTCFHRGELEPAAPHEALPMLERTIAERADTRPHNSYTATLLADRAAGGRQGAGGGRGGGPRRARGIGRARGRGGRRRDLSPGRAAAKARGCRWPTPNGFWMAVASPDTAPAGVTPSLQETRALARAPQPDPGPRDVHRRLPDARLGVPEATGTRSRVPARVGRAGPRRPLLVHRLSPAQGAALVARRRRRSVRARGRGAEPLRPAPLPDLPPFAGGAVGVFAYDLVRTVEPLGEPNPDPIGMPDLALMLTDATRRVRPPQAHGHRAGQRVRRRRSRGLLRAGAGDDRGGPLAAERPAPASAPGRRGAVGRCPCSRRTCHASSSRPTSPGSSSTSAPATPTRSSPRSAGRRRLRSRRSRSTAVCARSTPAPTCTSWTSATSRSPAPARSR